MPGLVVSRWSEVVVAPSNRVMMPTLRSAVGPVIGGAKVSLVKTARANWGARSAPSGCGLPVGTRDRDCLDRGSDRPLRCICNVLCDLQSVSLIDVVDNQRAK